MELGRGGVQAKTVKIQAPTPTKKPQKETKQAVEFGDIGETKPNTHKRKTILLENISNRKRNTHN